MSKNNKSTDFLKECIADALLQLLKTRPLEKITIDDMIELAGVGRSTYFRNFSSKEEVLSFKYIQMWKRFLNLHAVEITAHNALENMRYILEFCYSMRSMNTMLYDLGLKEAMYHTISLSIKEYDMTDPSQRKEKYIHLFFSYGIWGITKEWMERNYEDSIDELTEIFSAQWNNNGGLL